MATMDYVSEIVETRTDIGAWGHEIVYVGTTHGAYAWRHGRRTRYFIEPTLDGSLAIFKDESM
jgi:hypothetical protein